MTTRRIAVLIPALAFLWAGTARAEREWYLAVDRFDQGGGWIEEDTGGYDDGEEGTPFDGRYWWGVGFDGVRRAYWKFDNNANCVGPEIPSEPRLYIVDTWVPPAHSTEYSPIEVIMGGYDRWLFWDEEIPWNGQSGTNRQWLQRREGNQGDWVEAGLGPQAPDAGSQLEPPCNASGGGKMVWLKRGSVLYVMFNHGFYWEESEVGVSAIRIREVQAPEVGICDPPVAGGPLDLRCAGNADPLLGAGTDYGDSQDNDKFAQADDKMVNKNEWTLGAEGWVAPCSDKFMYPEPASIFPGLPPSGDFVVQLPSEQVNFKFRYDGLNSLKWITGRQTGPFAENRVFILNETAEREFTQKTYQNLYVLSVKQDNSGELVAEAVYTDDSTETFAFKLYHWMDEDGDANSQAVGVGGELRTTDPWINGFDRVRKGSFVGHPDYSYPFEHDAGDHSGAFLMFHHATLNPAKTLKSLRFSVRADERGLGGTINVVAVSLDGSACGNPVFDVVGGGPLGDNPDGAVDQRDFGIFQMCMMATALPGENFDPIICGCFDIDANGVIDGNDFWYFENCWTGPAPAVPADPSCDDLIQTMGASNAP